MTTAVTRRKGKAPNSVVVEEHFHIFTRDFFSGIDTDQGIWSTREIAVHEAEKIVRDHAKVSTKEFIPGTLVVTLQPATTTVRVRPCQKKECHSIWALKLLGEDR